MSSPTTPANIGPGEFFPVVGVGPHEKPWPKGDQFDPELLLNGDRRNVLDKYFPECFLVICEMSDSKNF